MIKTEVKGDLVRTWSDRGMMIRGGNPEGIYEETIDPVAAGRVYVETDIPIEDATAEEIVEILTGEDE